MKLYSPASTYKKGEYCSVLQITPPPFATLALVQNTGRAYTRDATFSLAITPSLNREIFSGQFVNAGFVLVLPFHHKDLEPTVCRSFGEVGGPA